MWQPNSAVLNKAKPNLHTVIQKRVCTFTEFKYRASVAYQINCIIFLSPSLFGCNRFHSHMIWIVLPCDAKPWPPQKRLVIWRMQILKNTCCEQDSAAVQQSVILTPTHVTHFRPVLLTNNTSLDQSITEIIIAWEGRAGIWAECLHPATLDSAPLLPQPPV